MTDRELRERLEQTQARVQALRLALKEPPDVSAQLGALEAQAEALESQRRELVRRAQAARDALETSSSVVQQVRGEQRADFTRSIQERTLLLVVSLSTGFVGVFFGAVGLYVLMTRYVAAWWTPVPLVLAAALWCWTMYRLGKAS